jgi:hypothetical protein
MQTLVVLLLAFTSVSAVRVQNQKRAERADADAAQNISEKVHMLINASAGTGTYCCCKKGECKEAATKALTHHQYKKDGVTYCCKKTYSFTPKSCPIFGYTTLVGEFNIENGCQLPKECPEGTEIGPDRRCRCEKGTKGSVDWNFDSSTWSVKCQKLDCPEHSVGHPECKCDSPVYSGELTFVAPGEDAHFEGKCEATCDAAVPVPASDDLEACGHGPADCDNPEKHELAFFTREHCEEGGLGCMALGKKCCRYCGFGAYSSVLCPCSQGAACPPNAFGYPVCRCNEGFSGKLTWNVDRYQGACELLACPEHSSGHPDCHCDKGYLGNIEWQVDKYDGVCVRIGCPEHSSGFPDCDCELPFKGELSWNGIEYVGKCELDDAEVENVPNDGICHCLINTNEVTWVSSNEMFTDQETCWKDCPDACEAAKMTIGDDNYPFFKCEENMCKCIDFKESDSYKTLFAQWTFHKYDADARSTSPYFVKFPTAQDCGEKCSSECEEATIAVDENNAEVSEDKLEGVCTTSQF